MRLKARIENLEKLASIQRYQQRDIALIVGCYACRNHGQTSQYSRDDEYCEHEQQNLDKWIAEHGGREPDEIIWIIGAPSRTDKPSVDRHS